MITWILCLLSVRKNRYNKGSLYTVGSYDNFDCFDTLHQKNLIFAKDLGPSG